MSLGVPLGLGSGLCWGAADFFGGVQSRRLPALTVAFWSQVGGALALAAALGTLLLLGNETVFTPAGPTGDASGPDRVGLVPAGAAAGLDRVGLVPAGVAWGLVAGFGGGCALVLFYRSLADGTMSVVAPISACGAIVPVAAALLTGHRPDAIAALGILTAIAGVVLVSRTSSTHRRTGTLPSAPERSPDPPGERPRAPARGWVGREVVMALGAALGFGLFYVFVDAGTRAGAAPVWVIAGARVSSLLMLSTIALAGRRPRLQWPGRRIGPVALVGIGDTTANLLFAYAATSGNLAVVGVLGSLYPVATVLLARWLLGERLSRGQNAGVVLALTGVGLLAAA